MLCDFIGQTNEYLGNSEEINSPGTNIFKLPSIDFNFHHFLVDTEHLDNNMVRNVIDQYCSILPPP